MGAFSVFAAITLRFIFLFLVLELYFNENYIQFISKNSEFFLERLFFAAALALVLYLFMRLCFAKPLPAALVSTLSGLLLNFYGDTNLLLSLSLMCLFFWMCVDYTEPLFFNAFWLVISGVLFAAAMLSCWQCAWLGPYYFMAYAVTQVCRYRGGENGTRKNKLHGSIALTALCLLLGTLVLWLAYYLLSGRSDSALFETLHSEAFVRDFFPTLLEKLQKLFALRPSCSAEIFARDVVLFIAGSSAVVPLLHGIFKARDSRCIFLLALQLFLLVETLFTGVYLLPLALLLSFGWLLSVYEERDFRIIGIVYAGVLAALFVALLILY